MTAKRLPRILRGIWRTYRQFKVDKRGKARELERVASQLRLGCAYMPREAYDNVQELCKRAKLLRAQLSVKEWGR